MSLNTIRTTIEATVAAEMASAPTYSVAYNNTTYSPPNHATWVRCTVQFGDSGYATLLAPSGGRNMQTGTVALDIFSPIGTGTGDSLTIADRLKALFQRQILSGLAFDPVVGPSIIQPSVHEGFYQLQLTSTFEAYLN